MTRDSLAPCEEMLCPYTKQTSRMATGPKLAPLPAGAPMDDGSENTHEKSHWELNFGDLKVGGVKELRLRN